MLLLKHAFKTTKVLVSARSSASLRDETASGETKGRGIVSSCATCGMQEEVRADCNKIR